MGRYDHQGQESQCMDQLLFNSRMSLSLVFLCAKQNPLLMLNSMLTGLWVARSQGLNEDGCVWNQLSKFRRTVIILITSEHGGRCTAKGFTAQVKGALCFFLPTCCTFIFIHISGTLQECLEHTVAALALYKCTVSLRSMPQTEEECLSPFFPSLSSSLVFLSEPRFLETS